MVKMIIGFINNILGTILFFLPNSPFDTIIDSMESIPILNSLAWIIPFDAIITVSEAWLVAITAFYLYSALLRWVKAIE